MHLLAFRPVKSAGGGAWDNRGNGAGRKFILGMDAHPEVVRLAEALGKQAWRSFERLSKYEILTEPRTKAIRYKEQVVVEREFGNKKLLGEDLAEIEYQPLKCGRPYRLIILRKNISVQKGEQVLFDEVRNFFYITFAHSTGITSKQIQPAPSLALPKTKRHSQRTLGPYFAA